LASLHNRLLLALGRQPTSIQNASAHVRGWTRRDLVRFLNTAFPGGYKVERWGGSNFYPLPPALARPMARLVPGMAWGLFMLLRKQTCYDKQFVDYPGRAGLETNFFRGPM
jgi:hypothetical protein